MKLLPLFLAGIAACAFNACEKQPYSKIESITATEHAENTDAHASEAKPAEKSEAKPHDKAVD